MFTPIEALICRLMEMTTTNLFQTANWASDLNDHKVITKRNIKEANQDQNLDEVVESILRAKTKITIAQS